VTYFARAAAIVCLAAATALAAGPGSSVPLTAAASFGNEGKGAALLPVVFEAPLAKSDMGPAGGCRLIGGPGNSNLCQAVPTRKPPQGSRRWYSLAALLPYKDATYLLSWTNEDLPPDTPVVTTLVESDNISLDTGQVRVYLDRGRFDVFDQLSAAGRDMIPRYVTDLFNAQQGVEVVLTDRIRHVDFTLLPDASPECSVESTGPVVTTVLYKGTLSNKDMKGVGYEARVTLAASGVAGLDMRIVPGAFDTQVLAAKSVKITLPTVLKGAAALSFGGTAAHTEGREFWKGKGRLTARGDGFELVEGDAATMPGKDRVTWASYADDVAGIGVAWGTRQAPAEVAVDYNEDLVSVTLTPRSSTASPAEVVVYFAFKPLYDLPEVLPGIAEAIDNPPTMTVSEDYLKAAK
jgi:hypothetical protein